MSSDKKILPKDFIKMKKKNRKIVMITAYTYYQAKIADEAGVDGILVGDSLGMVIMGYQSTLPVKLSEMLHHLKAVLNAKPKSLVVADMPFLTYEVSIEQAIRNCGKAIKLGADAVKLEGGEEIFDIVKALVKAGIPVMGHIGLNPQRYLTIGGYKLIGKKAVEASRLVNDAKALEEAGVFAIVIENVVADIAKLITEEVSVPTICIGAGPYCDGQILVFHDVVGINPRPPPFAKKYLNAYELMLEAIANYADEVRSGNFPSKDYYRTLSEEELKKVMEALKITSKKT